MKSKWVENLWAAILILFMIVALTMGVLYEYVKFCAYWKVAFGG